MLTDRNRFALLNTPLEISHEFSAAQHTCIPSDTIGSVVQRLASLKVHRLYLVNSLGQPCAVVALRDIIAKFVCEPPECELYKFFQS